ncbi:phage holin family protein [Naasia lichenicola]|uniref:Phage holin family protein n=1 Tax=Naasia lichenicola TaxID=2565933 RepID=A0A4S4FGP7_9MICO|nr:phage holin family protein [Naasia lichenicola]THG29429.1 phage holin family protein [Naasia lichenicola]
MSNPTSPGSSSAASSSAKKKSLIALIGDLPGLVGSLIRDEIEQIKKELTAKLVSLGIGAGLFAGAAFFAFFAFAVLIAAAVLGIATALPGWLAALIVAVALLVITAILVLIGLRKVKKGVPPVPEQAIESVKNDVRAIKGVGNYDR